MGSDQQKNDGLFTFISTGLNFLIEGCAVRARSSQLAG